MKKIITLGFSICLFCAAAWAQGTAQLHGTVRDASGATVPGAEVKVVQTDTGATRTVSSGQDGDYVVASLPPGPYRIEVSKEGFSRAVETGVVLQVNTDPLVDVALKVGAVTEQVNVEANAAQVETRSSSVGQVVENARIMELPLNGRNVTDLITLSGAAVVVATTRDSMGGGANPTPIIQVAGGLAYATSYSLDGTTHLNTNSGGAMPMPFPDALQEFKVDTSGASIDQGKSSGVSAVTKSGTNVWHGSLFEFMRNDAVNARAYLAVDQSTLKRNQFGGTIGGAIIKDKLFIFGGYQQTMIRANPNDLETFLPTDAMLAGDWTTFASPACNNGTQLQFRGGFVNNQLPAALTSKTGLAIAQMTRASAPTPNECGFIRYGRPSRVNEYQPVVRGDYQISDKHSLFVRYQNLLSKAPNPFFLTNPGNVLNAGTSGTDNVIQSLSIGSTYVVSPTVVNSFRIGGNYALAHTMGAETFSICDAQIKAGVPVTYYCGQAPHRSTFTIVGGPALGSGSQQPFDSFTMTAFSLSDDVSMIRGSHQLAFGFTGVISTNKSNWNALNINKLTMNSASTGSGWGDVMRGNVAQMIQTGSNHMDITALSPSLYVSDTWKVAPRLTISGALRWDPFFPQYLKNGGTATFDRGRFDAGIQTPQYKYAPMGWYYPGDPGHPGNRGATVKWKNFAPRIGLAWDVNGDGRTSVRANYAYTWAPVLNYWRQDQYAQSPWNNGTRLSGVLLDNAWANYTWVDPVSGATRSGTPFPFIEGVGFTQVGDYTSTPYDIQAPTTQSWNLSIQRQIGSDLVVSATYMGTHAQHIWIQDYLNPGIIVGPPPSFPGTAATAGNANCLPGLTIQQCSGANNVNERRVFTLARPNDIIKTGSVALLYSGANLNYNGLLLSAQKRLSRGTSLQANYTWSHCTSDAADLQSSGPDSGESHTMPGNRAHDHGNCQGDRRQLFNLTGSAQTPKFSAKGLRMVASDWKFSGIYRFQSGAPIDMSAGSDRMMNGQLSYFSGGAYQRATQLLPNDQAYTGNSKAFQNFINQAAIGVPALGTLGNYSRYNLVGPTRWNLDLAVSRIFRVAESQNVEVRGEAFNLTNSFRAGDPGATFSNGSNAQRGQIRSALDSRILQFALKYSF